MPLDVLYHALTSLIPRLCFHVYQLPHSEALFLLFLLVEKSLGDLLICCRQTVDSCLALYFTTGRLPARCYSENVLDLLHSLPGM